MRLLVTVGTDHHPFDRVVQWVESWTSRQDAGAVECFMQIGTSRPPALGGWQALVDFDVLDRHVSEADVVVCHGGPGTIVHCHRRGLFPVVVARDHLLGEHVDGHQIAFTARLAAAGQIRLAGDEQQLDAQLDAVLAEPDALRRDPETHNAGPAIERLREIVDPLVARPGSSRHRRRPSAAATVAAPAVAGRILYIGGWGRSGSTLLERMLGQLDGVASVGEVREVFFRGWTENRLCGCGVPFRGCQFWEAVGEKAFGGWRSVDVGEIAALRSVLDRPWSAPLLLRPEVFGRTFASQLSRYVDVLRALYGAIAAVSGAQVIVDSSKLPTYGMILHRAVPGGIRLVHLVRDSRGVVYSWQKQVARPDHSGPVTGDDRMIRFGLLSAAIRYDLYNGETQLLRRAGVPYVRLRYEDLIDRPREQLQAVMTHSGLDSAHHDMSFVGGHQVKLRATHTVDGNPMRFTNGSVPLRADDEWRSRMSGPVRGLVGVCTAPFLAQYGYGTGRLRKRVDALV